ncbi:MAG: hypothetical protein H6797_01230 [Candidatus Nomurabacteria bacterium]|nr:hypothetical protein [Candidatus Saccharibacteria bacterium]USN96809.1 MAG: hypothetical protein H6797_01230 [Candidatus Nomurabacteria bacterium]
MSDTDDTKEKAIIEPSQAVELPPQQSATDTSNWDNKVSTDPSGEKYIRTIDEEDLL